MKAIFLCFLMLSVCSCTVSEDDQSRQTDAANTSTIDTELRSIILDKNITASPSKGLALPSINTPIAQLGKKLFFSRSLSGGRDTACASCHHPKLMGGDGLSLPVGVGAIDPNVIGPGRRHDLTQKDKDDLADGAPNVPRHSLSTFNTALYKQALFWDSRIHIKADGIVTPDSLVLGEVDMFAQPSLLGSQAFFPVTSIEEMQGHTFLKGASNTEVREALRDRLIAESDSDFSWIEEVRSAFDLDVSVEAEQLLSLERLAEALAAYQSSQIFINNVWADYVQGNTAAISDSAKRGAKLFYMPPIEGGVGCASCHAGAAFTDENTHIAGFPQLGRGKGVGQSDKGRFLVNKNEQDSYAFRTPSLLNVALTAPYGHAGSFADLQSLLVYHSDPIIQIDQFDFSLQQLPQFYGSGYFYLSSKANTQLAVDKLQEQLSNQVDHPLAATLSDEDIDDLIAFLDTLSDKCLEKVSAGVTECIQPWLLEEDLFPGRLNSQFADFSNNSVGWEPPTPEGSLPEKIGSLGFVSAVVEQCEYRVKESGGGLLFTEVGESSGLGHVLTPINLSQVFGEGLVDLGYLDKLESGGFAGLAIAGDFNQDEFFDLILYSGIGLAPRVMINDAAGEYTEQTAAWGLAAWENKQLLGGGVADLDGDGDLDLVLGGRKTLQNGLFDTAGFMEIYRNDSGKWVKVDQTSSVQRPIYSISFTDYDVDGDLDITTASWSYLIGAKEQHIWDNQGGLLFEGAGEDSGLVQNLLEADYSFSPINVDLTGNMYPDLILVSDFTNTLNLFNAGSGKYVSALEVSKTANNFTEENGMGGAAADFDNDGDIDIFITSISEPIGTQPGALGFYGTGNRLYINDGSGGLVDNSQQAGVRGEGWSWGWGACAADFNSDGHTDIFHVNGYGSLFSQKRTDLAGFLAGWMADTSKLFISNKDGTFTEQAVAQGIDDKDEGRGVACYDYDRDGDIDILVVDYTGKVKLFENNFNQSDRNLLLELFDEKTANSQAIGAKISLKNLTDTGPALQYKEVQANTNFISQSPSLQHFGLEGNDGVYDVEITWPRPALEKTVIKGVRGNQCLKVIRLE